MEVHSFPKDICPKVNVIAQLEFQYVYFEAAVHQHLNLDHTTIASLFNYVSERRFIHFVDTLFFRIRWLRVSSYRDIHRF